MSIKLFPYHHVVTPKDFPYLTRFSHLLEGSPNGAIGREQLIPSLEESLNRHLMRNSILLGPAGVGKTAFMEAFAYHIKQKGTLVLNIELASMAGAGDYKFAENFSELNKEILRLVDYREAYGYKGDVVLFLDEFHLLTMGSNATGGSSNAANAIKPLASRQHIRIVGATTDEEYQMYIKPDQALERRFIPLQIEEPSHKVLMQILKQFAVKAEPSIARVFPQFLYEEIIKYTNLYQPAFSQPAKALNMVDRILARCKIKHVKPSHSMLRSLFLEINNVDIDFKTDIFKTREILERRVKGQNDAIRMVENHLFTANAGLQDEKGPVARFLFAGPTGVGKTELAKAIAEAMFGDEDKMIRFDMSEYNLEEDTRVFQKRLSSQIEKKPFSVVLFDELEKASRGIMNLCLGILDDGRLTNEYGRQTTFNNSIIIMTTNAAANIFKTIKEQSLNIEESEEIIRDDLEKTFSPEFLGRFDELIAFQPLTVDNFEMILEKNMTALQKRVMKKHKVPLRYSNEVPIYLLHENFKALTNTSAGGGRAVGRRINREVTPLVSRAIDYCQSQKLTLTNIQLNVAGELRYFHKDLIKGIDPTLVAAFQVKEHPGVVFEIHGLSLKVERDSIKGYKRRMKERKEANKQAKAQFYNNNTTTVDPTMILPD